jgi:hypothetical protein
MPLKLLPVSDHSHDIKALLVASRTFMDYLLILKSNLILYLILGWLINAISVDIHAILKRIPKHAICHLMLIIAQKVVQTLEAYYAWHDGPSAKLSSHDKIILTQENDKRDGGREGRNTDSIKSADDCENVLRHLNSFSTRDELVDLLLASEDMITDVKLLSEAIKIIFETIFCPHDYSHMEYDEGDSIPHSGGKHRVSLSESYLTLLNILLSELSCDDSYRRNAAKVTLQMGLGTVLSGQIVKDNPKLQTLEFANAFTGDGASFNVDPMKVLKDGPHKCDYFQFIRALMIFDDKLVTQLLPTIKASLRQILKVESNVKHVTDTLVLLNFVEERHMKILNRYSEEFVDKLISNLKIFESVISESSYSVMEFISTRPLLLLEMRKRKIDFSRLFGPFFRPIFWYLIFWKLSDFPVEKLGSFGSIIQCDCGATESVNHRDYFSVYIRDLNDFFATLDFQSLYRNSSFLPVTDNNDVIHNMSQRLQFAATTTNENDITLHSTMAVKVHKYFFQALLFLSAHGSSSVDHNQLIQAVVDDRISSVHQTSMHDIIASLASKISRSITKNDFNVFVLPIFVQNTPDFQDKKFLVDFISSITFPSINAIVTKCNGFTMEFLFQIIVKFDHYFHENPNTNKDSFLQKTIGTKNLSKWQQKFDKLVKLVNCCPRHEMVQALETSEFFHSLYPNVKRACKADQIIVENEHFDKKKRAFFDGNFFNSNKKLKENETENEAIGNVKLTMIRPVLADKYRRLKSLNYLLSGTNSLEFILCRQFEESYQEMCNGLRADDSGIINDGQFLYDVSAIFHDLLALFVLPEDELNDRLSNYSSDSFGRVSVSVMNMVIKTIVSPNLIHCSDAPLGPIFEQSRTKRFENNAADIVLKIALIYNAALASFLPHMVVGYDTNRRPTVSISHFIRFYIEPLMKFHPLEVLRCILTAVVDCTYVELDTSRPWSESKYSTLKILAQLNLEEKIIIDSEKRSHAPGVKECCFIIRSVLLLELFNAAMEYSLNVFSEDADDDDDSNSASSHRRPHSRLLIDHWKAILPFIVHYFFILDYSFSYSKTATTTAIESENVLFQFKLFQFEEMKRLFSSTQMKLEKAFETGDTNTFHPIFILNTVF